MKKFFIALSLTSVGMLTFVSPASAYDAPIVSTTPCLIDIPKVAPLNATKQGTLDDLKISIPGTSFHCPENVLITHSNVIGTANGSSLAEGEWAIVYPNFPNDNHGYPTSIGLGVSSWPIDPFSKVASWGYYPVGVYAQSLTFSNDNTDSFQLEIRDTEYQEGAYLNLATKDAPTYLIYNNGNTTTMYPLKFSSDIVLKYESTVTVSAKSKRNILEIKAYTSRNRTSQLASRQQSAFGKLLFAYPGDKATLYRDGHKVAVAKIARNGKVTFKVKKTKKVHTYEVRIAENAINFAGSGSVIK